MRVFMSIPIAIIILCIIGFIRNNLILTYRLRALDVISGRARAAMLDGQPWELLYAKYDVYGSYDQMFFDLFHWRYRDFYPDLAKDSK